MAVPRVAALLLAAGSGSRLGGQAKAFLEVAGEPLFVRSLRAIAGSGAIDGVVMVVPEAFVDQPVRWRGELASRLGLFLVRPGGQTRQESVRIGLESLPDATEVVVCHDAARPFAGPNLFRRVIAALHGADGVVPAIASPDTVKRVQGSRVIETIPREAVRLAQTPQAFSAGALRQAHRLAHDRGMEATDDATLLEAAGFAVVTVEGEPGNFKVTTAADLARAEDLLGSRVAVPVEGGP